MVGLRTTFHKICSDSYCKGVQKCSNPLHYCLQTTMAHAVPARCNRAHQLMSRAIPHCPLNMSPSMADRLTDWSRTWWGREGRWHHHHRVFHCKQILYYAGKWFLENPASSNFHQDSKRTRSSYNYNNLAPNCTPTSLQLWQEETTQTHLRLATDERARTIKKIVTHCHTYLSIRTLYYQVKQKKACMMSDTAYNHIPLCKITAEFFTKTRSRTSPTAATPRRDSTSTRNLLLLPLRSPKVRTTTRTKWARNPEIIIICPA